LYHSALQLAWTLWCLRKEEGGRRKEEGGRRKEEG
jgi:hypothetical protein